MQRIDVKDLDLEGLVSALTREQLLATTYANCRLPVSEVLVGTIATLEKEIKDRRRDFLLAQAKTINARLEQLKSADEKKVDLAEELRKINEALAAT